MERSNQYCIRCLKPAPGATNSSPCCGTNLIDLYCACHAPVEGPGDCHKCGRSHVAPPCPKCGNPVTHVPDESTSGRWFSSVVWNRSWVPVSRGDDVRRRCVSCGYDFAAALALETGHRSYNSDENPAKSEIEISGGLSSVYSGHPADMMDLQPTVEVRIKRRTPGSRLAEEAAIAMTPGEWKAVIEQLQGPLQTLLLQKAWWEDHT